MTRVCIRNPFEFRHQILQRPDDKSPSSDVATRSSLDVAEHEPIDRIGNVYHLGVRRAEDVVFDQDVLVPQVLDSQIVVELYALRFAISLLVGGRSLGPRLSCKRSRMSFSNFGGSTSIPQFIRPCYARHGNGIPTLGVWQHRWRRPEIDDVLGQARAYNNLAIAYTDKGDWENASEALSTSLEINKRIGNIQEQGFIANNLANIHLYRGEWDQAEALYKQSNEIWRMVGAALPEAVVLSNLAQVHIYQENLTSAFDALQKSQEVFTKLDSEDFLSELERRWGEYFLRLGELDEALQHTNRSIELASSQEGRLDQGISLRILGEVYKARKEFEDAEIALKHSLRILTDLNSEYEAAKTMLSIAYLAFEREEMVDRQQLDQAIEILKMIGAKIDVGRAEELKKQL